MGGRRLVSLLFSRAGVSNWICRRRMSTLSVSDGSSRSTKVLPWLMLPPAVEGGQVTHNFYSLGESRVLSIRGGGDGLKLGFNIDDTKFVGSSKGWLALLNKTNDDLLLTNPLSQRHLKLPPVPGPLNPDNIFGCVEGLITSFSPNEEEEENCRAMMIYGYELAFCCPGRSTEWTPIGSRLTNDGFNGSEVVRVYESFVYSAAQELFFCVTDNSDFEAWDLRDPHSPVMIPMNDLSADPEMYPVAYRSREELVMKYMCRRMRSLVVDEKSGQLFLVIRFVANNVDSNGSFVSPDLCYDESLPYKTIDFDVHKYDPESRAFMYMDHGSSLGGDDDGLALFIGTNHSFAISAKDYPEGFVKPDSIYFTDDLLRNDFDDDDELDYGGHDIGIFSYKDRSFSPCYYPSDAKSFRRISPSPMWYFRVFT
ncbi:hypothetical protein ABFS83_11G101900 [Erythranthe nasuta]